MMKTLETHKTSSTLETHKKSSTSKTQHTSSTLETHKIGKIRKRVLPGWLTTRDLSWRLGKRVCLDDSRCETYLGDSLIWGISAKSFALETRHAGSILETWKVGSTLAPFGVPNILMSFFIGWCLMRGNFS